MNKNDLIQKLSDTTGLAKNDAAKAVDGVFECITDALKAGDEVRLTGFGVFWSGEGAGVSWPGGEAAIVGVLVFVAVLAFVLTGVLRATANEITP